MADERTSDSVKTRYDIALMNLNDIKIAVFRDSLSTYVEQKTGLTIQFNWPKSRCLVISTLCKIPFPTKSAAELQEMCKYQRFVSVLWCVILVFVVKIK
uniref:U17 n=1 Tax=Human betaherpesvirus 6 TaxID=10368 RepID=A0A1W6G711_9BETA|nr:hypothetical protein [Human betaherpesvirus 6]ARM08585.1 hypothetical protein [Human betaherpesvirus 6]ARM09434.1 hypothetical protein [Human betaherpesvirus 6]ARM60974.1 hypothetical protein [Human betaherpesvirus 6]ARM61208.1 hypothetical protein [Human betaherpesvirus 6]